MDVTIGRGGKFGTVAVDPDELPVHVRDFIWEYGIRQILNDAVSDKEGLTDEEVLAKAREKYQQLLTGELRKRGTSEPIDPVEREAFGMAKEAIERALRKLGFWPKKGTEKLQAAITARRATLKKRDMSVEEYVTAWLDANPNVRKEAARRVREAEKAAAELPEAL